MKIEMRFPSHYLSPEDLVEVETMVRERFQAYIEEEHRQMVERLLYGDHRTRLHEPVGISRAGVIKWDVPVS